jgi:hypothetical protein
MQRPSPLVITLLSTARETPRGTAFGWQKQRQQAIGQGESTSDGVTDIKHGDHVIDIQYYEDNLVFERCNAEDNLVFEPEEKHATVHVESILPVKGIELQGVVPPLR